MATPSMNLSGKTREVVRKVRGQPTSDGAGVRLTRVIGTGALDSFDPFLLLDEFRSDNPNDYLAGFPNHPHRGFETVTYMLAGRMRHGDNQGNEGLLGPGSVQWMTAGRGIVHSEFLEQQEGAHVGLPALGQSAAHGQDDGAAISRHPRRPHSGGRGRARRACPSARRHGQRRSRAGDGRRDGAGLRRFAFGRRRELRRRIARGPQRVRVRVCGRCEGRCRGRRSPAASWR